MFYKKNNTIDEARAIADALIKIIGEWKKSSIKGISIKRTRNDMTNSLSKRAKEQLKLREDKNK